MMGNSLLYGVVSLLTNCLALELNWRLLPRTCCSMFRRSRSTDFTCAVSQAVRILNICETFHEIQVPLNFLFKFTGINLVLVNIKPVEFHLIRLCSFCNIYMSNDVKFFETLLHAQHQLINCAWLPYLCHTYPCLSLYFS